MLDFLKGIKKGDQLEIDIEYRNPDYLKWYPVWQKNRDFFEGTTAIKTRTKSEIDMTNNIYHNGKNSVAGTAYLPWPSGMTKEEYDQYVDRSQYANYVEETIQSWQGKLYSKPIQYNYSTGDNAENKTTPTDNFLDSITFDGKSADNVIREITGEIELVNKVGVLIDFPTVLDYNNNPIKLTKKYVEDNNIKSRVSMYKAESITHWGETVRNNQRIPTFFVLREENPDYSSFMLNSVCMYRVLYLDNVNGESIYRQAIIKPIDKRKRRGNKYKAEVVDVYTPMKGGNYINEIPFKIITALGEEYRDYKNSIVAPLVDVNMGHYRNSADWEHELFQVALKTLVLYGWDKKKYGNPRMGGALAAPMNGKAELLEASSDSGIKDEMQNKENRMAVFGSQRISQQGRYVQSADTSNNNTKSESANLQSIALNVSKIMGEVFSLCAEWSNKEYKISLDINRDFKDDTITGDEANKWREWYQTGGGSFDAYYAMMEKKEAYPPGHTKEQEIELILNNPMFSSSNPEIDGMRRELEELRNQLNGDTDNDNGDNTVVEDLDNE